MSGLGGLLLFDDARRRTQERCSGLNRSASRPSVLSFGRKAARMIPRVHTLLLCLMAMLALAGCASTANLAKNESSTCEVHKCTMTIQVVDCAPGGFSGYRPEYDTARWTQFPHHGRIHFSEDHGYIYARHLQTYVCPDCTKVHDEWRKEHPNK